MTAKLLQSALNAHQAGRLADAEDGYRAVLKRDPRHLDALYLLGLLLYQSGRVEESLTPLGRAVESTQARPEHQSHSISAKAATSPSPISLPPAPVTSE